MPDQPSIHPKPKPISEVWKPELVFLPRLTPARRAFRVWFRLMMKLITYFTLRVTSRGLENFPGKGSAVIVFNHLGDADTVLLRAVLPGDSEAIAKIELNDHRLVGPVFRAYGFIWVHRGRPDRKALRAALDALAQGRRVTLAPEGRQSLTGGLEEGTDGAAFIALKSGAPIVPIALTGTENDHIYSHLKRWRRAPVSITVGKPFHLREHADRQAMLREGTHQIMESIANLLPETYRGKFNSSQ
jgi:1-acyl-sn-glycerol-3-phosphate acyltransferase